MTVCKRPIIIALTKRDSLGLTLFVIAFKSAALLGTNDVQYKVTSQGLAKMELNRNEMKYVLGCFKHE